jgi:hypothetical protein
LIIPFLSTTLPIELHTDGDPRSEHRREAGARALVMFTAVFEFIALRSEQAELPCRQRSAAASRREAITATLSAGACRRSARMIARRSTRRRV